MTDVFDHTDEDGDRATLSPDEDNLILTVEQPKLGDFAAVYLDRLARLRLTKAIVAHDSIPRNALFSGPDCDDPVYQRGYQHGHKAATQTAALKGLRARATRTAPDVGLDADLSAPATAEELLSAAVWLARLAKKK